MRTRSLYTAATVFALLLSSYAKAQQVNYKVLKNDPTDVNNLWVYADLAQMDGGWKNIDGFSFNLGTWAVAEYKNKIGGEFILRYGWLTLGKLADNNPDLHKHHQLEIGGFLQLKESTKTKNTNIVLSQSKSVQAGREVTTTSSISIPATRIVKMGVRGGIVNMGGVYGTDTPASDAVSVSLPDKVNYSMTGIYAGILSTSVTNILVDTDSHGKRGKFKQNRVYVDAMLFPIRAAKLAGVDYKSSIDPGMIGFRLGWQAMPAETRKIKEHDVKTMGSGFQVEAGIRPFDGIFITGTWSLPVLRTKSPMLGYTGGNAAKGQ